MQGFLEAFADSRLAVKRDLWLTRISNFAKAKGLNESDPAVHETYVDAIAAHLKHHPEITAIFGTEYSASKAGWDAARQIGKRVPEDISIVSFDFDSSYLGLHLLSHVKQPQKSIGSCAVKVMGDILHGKALESRSFLLEGEWVEGDSMASPNEAVQKIHIAI
jgi:DNA-binding LacI/PurR family transcriptional regulator